jgi:hypothetical protein
MATATPSRATSSKAAATRTEWRLPSLTESLLSVGRVVDMVAAVCFPLSGGR